MERANQELAQIVVKFSQPADNISPLTMILQGTIEAAVNGGVKNYIDAFFSAEFVAATANDKTNVRKRERER
jgi:dedicator of cytokinesis protein 1